MKDVFTRYTFKQIGACEWATESDVEKLNLKFGEEFTYEMIGRQFTEVATHTKEGWMAIIKIWDKFSVSKNKCGKHFQIMVCCNFFIRLLC